MEHRVTNLGDWMQVLLRLSRIAFGMERLLRFVPTNPSETDTDLPVQFSEKPIDWFRSRFHGATPYRRATHWSFRQTGPVTNRDKVCNLSTFSFIPKEVTMHTAN